MNIEREEPRRITGKPLEELKRMVIAPYELNNETPPSDKEVKEILKERGYNIEE
jgi:hypothetical protein